jgi:hypothetical protein
MRVTTLVLALLTASHGVTAAPWIAPGDISLLAASEQHAFLELLADANVLAYTSTHGSYYEPSKANATLQQPGWKRVAEANPYFGMHGIAFANASAERLLVVFRGTDLNTSGLSGQADVCADAWLWGPDGAPAPASLPSFCAQFTATQLDYFGNAVAFAWSVAAAFPTFSVLFTGHSLGAGLASMLALWPQATPGRGAARCIAPSSSGALGFAAPDFLSALQARVPNPALIMTDSALSRIAIFADAFDPVQGAALFRPSHGMVGQLWLWRDGADPPSTECLECFDVGHVQSPQSLMCLVCMAQRHVFSHYVSIIRSGLAPSLVGPVADCVTNSSICMPLPSVNVTC